MSQAYNTRNPVIAPLSATEYDEMWARFTDFSLHNPGARQRRRMIARLMRSLTNVDSVLDVGCGVGDLIRQLRGVIPHARFAGLDLSPHAIGHCASQFPDSSFHVLDITTDHLAEKFDLLICSEVTEHLAGPPVALRHMSEMLNPGGYLILTTPHGRIHAAERSIGHLVHPTRSELVGMLGDAGFRVLSLQQWGWPGYTAFKYAANLLPKRTIERFGTNNYTRGMKALNRACYYAVRALSLTSSPFGPQFVVLARAGLANHE